MKKILIGLLIVMVSLNFLGCGGNKKVPDPKKAESQKTITIGVMPDVDSIPFVIAEKNGYFTKEGVKVKIEHFKSARDRDSALQSGVLDGVVTDVVAVAFANEGGIKLRIISKHDGNIELMAGKDTGIKSVQDLKGRSIAMSTNTIMEYTADTMLQDVGLKPDDVKKVPIPQLPTRLEMLMGGKVDSAIMPEPLAGMAIKNGALILNSTDQTGNKCGAIAFRADILKDNPDEIKAVFRAYDKAVDYLNQVPIANYVDYVIKEQGFPEAVKGSLELPKYQKATAPDPKIVAGVVEWMQAKQLIKSKYEYKDLVDDRFLR